MSQNLIQAKKLAKEGDENLKTGLFKWSKDYASAAISYDEAAKLYRLGKDFDSAIKVYEKCATCNEKMNDSWGVARNYEAIVTMSIERTDKVTQAELLSQWVGKTGVYFKMANSMQTQINLVNKVCKYLEQQSNLTEAINLYKNLLNDLEDDDQSYLRSDVVLETASFLVKDKRYLECANLFERELALKKTIQSKTGSAQNLDSLALTIISLYLIMGDIEKAEKKLSDYSMDVKNFMKSQEFDVCEKMVQAYIDGKQDDFDKTAQRSVLNNIFPMNIIKEVRKVKVQAQPKKKVQNIDDIIQVEKTEDFGNYKPKEEDFHFEPIHSRKAEEPAVITEEQRLKMIDDFL